MASSFHNVSAPLSVVLPRREYVGMIATWVKNWNFGILMVCVSLVFAAVLSPERPDQLASICEKHNAVQVCQVW